MIPTAVIAHVRLVDRKLRVVELDAPASLASRYATDRDLLVDPVSAHGGRARPMRVGHCYESVGRRARFTVDDTSDGDRLLDHLAGRRPAVAGASPYTATGWRVEV